MRLAPTALVAVLALSACGPRYTLVPAAAPMAVAKKSMTVRPGAAWNRAPRGKHDIAWEENWTRNGPLLDSLGFVGGLPNGQPLAKQRRKEDRKVPVFRADMSPQDLVSMLESYYRIKAGATVFAADTVAPATFLGAPGLRFDYAWIGADQVKRRGRAVMAIVAGKLYLATLDGASLYYFDAALPDFTAMTEGARLG